MSKIKVIFNINNIYTLKIKYKNFLYKSTKNNIMNQINKI